MTKNKTVLFLLLLLPIQSKTLDPTQVAMGVTLGAAATISTNYALYWKYPLLNTLLTGATTSALALALSERGVLKTVGVSGLITAGTGITASIIYRIKKLVEASDEDEKTDKLIEKLEDLEDELDDRRHHRGRHHHRHHGHHNKHHRNDD